MYVRLTLVSNGDTCTYRTEIIPSLWQTVTLYIGDCPFRHRITHMAIEVQNASTDVWNQCQLRFDEVMAGLPIDLEFQLLQLEAVHLGQYLALLHVVAHLRVDFADAAAALGHDVVHGVGLDGGGITALLWHLAGLGHGHGHIGHSLLLHEGLLD